MSVHAWVEKVSIPTYQAGTPGKNPVFLEKRVYQGSSGVVYPHPVIESIDNAKQEKEYEAVFIENDYLKIMVLPELGGRIQRAYDKIRNRDFVYYNRVIKPALVGLTGPWISGGIEFNWPQHHRPSTFIPVDFSIEAFEDGSKTVWVSETEIMFRTKGMAGITLYPGKAYLEVKGNLFNGTPFPQSFLWWANPAVKVSDEYQSVFPQDVYAVFDHGKRDVSDFPVATGIYYRVNYAPGTDISKVRNVPVPTSFMAIESKYDFIGGYDNDSRAGMLHIADHHISPGKKQWTWGNGAFGDAWHKQLTDEDGPYIELMTGVFTDNQPDFSWIYPNETKTFRQYFLPYAEIGYVKNAAKEAAINVEWHNDDLQIKVYASSIYKDAAVLIKVNNKPVQKITMDISPEKIFSRSYTLPGIKEQKWEVAVCDQDGNELISYKLPQILNKEIPPAATAARPPSQIEQAEELFLNGLHLEQYRHATFNAMAYYEEGLKRNPTDARCNNAKGLLLLRRGNFSASEQYFRTAIATLTQRNPNPHDGEPYYNLGVCLVLQEKDTEAYDAFYKATWNDAWQHSGFLWLARIAARHHTINKALELAEKSLVRNYHSNAARHLKAILLRKRQQFEECIKLCEESIKIDAFNFGCIYERYIAETLLQKKEITTLDDLFGLMRHAENNFLELALEYSHAGFYSDAVELLKHYIDGPAKSPAKKSKKRLVNYYLGWLHTKNGQREEALRYFQAGARDDASMVFPNKLEEIHILQTAVVMNPGDGKASYYLGNLWYDKRRYDEAIACWQAAIDICGDLPTPYRNLAIALYNKKGDRELALKYLSKAFELDSTDARILMELDQLNKILNKPFRERLHLLEEHALLVDQRDDLYLERIILYNNLREYPTARRLLQQRNFHPWEGGEGKTTGQYLLCNVQSAKKEVLAHNFDEAMKLLNAAREYPENLGEGKLYGVQENEIDYLTGCVYEGLGLQDQAIYFYKQATSGDSEPVQSIYYNDPQPDKIFYRGLAWLALGEQTKAQLIFKKLMAFSEKHMDDEMTIDYFAVSLPDMLVFDIDLNQRNRNHCNYLTGLGYIGIGEYEKGKEYLNRVLRDDINHQGFASNLQMIDFLQERSSAIQRL